MSSKTKWALIFLICILSILGYIIIPAPFFRGLFFSVSILTLGIVIITSAAINKSLQKKCNSLEQKVSSSLEYIDALWESETDLVQEEKLNALNSLVARIANEISNPLGTSVTSSTFLEELIKEAEVDSSFKKSAHASLELIRNSLRKAISLINSIKDLAVGDNSESERQVNMKEYLQHSILEMCPRDKRDAHDIQVRCADDLQVNTYLFHLSIILKNILFNALEYAYPQKEKGVIILKAEKDDQDLLLTIQDFGIGISPKNQRFIFEPFYTSRKAAGHNGLGLSISYNLLTRYFGGKISLASEPGEGTSVMIRIPDVVEPPLTGKKEVPGNFAN